MLHEQALTQGNLAIYMPGRRTFARSGPGDGIRSKYGSFLGRIWSSPARGQVCFMRHRCAHVVAVHYLERQRWVNRGQTTVCLTVASKRAPPRCVDTAVRSIVDMAIGILSPDLLGFLPGRGSHRSGRPGRRAGGTAFAIRDVAGLGDVAQSLRQLGQSHTLGPCAPQYTSLVRLLVRACQSNLRPRWPHPFKGNVIGRALSGRYVTNSAPQTKGCSEKNTRSVARA